MTAALHTSQLSLLNSQAALPRLAQICVTAAVAVTVWDMRRRTRHTLARLDAHELRDIGLTPGQARAEADKAFYQR
ncbi:protein of unknown function [Loktanella fryxellensis]|uniref:YjiS-like domain-containing protein n=1 Tax=Loktanella fryxellensis TaxID=245187 RepID=A0A1H7YAI8_9RHOB|nr:DUF1127 domain-containing protein [Loktanella fryxellensis]SEM42337.1 protein of unknown function [Loktanella fryxellensis]